MIGYYGKWGSGKTLSLVARVYKSFLKNPDLVVFTNVPFDFGPHPKKGNRLIQYNYSEIMELQPFFIYAINTSHEILAKETIVIIDEASVVLSSRTFASLPTFMISFLAQARHINTNFFITAQAQWEVEKIVRALTHEWVHCNRIPLLGWISQVTETITTEGKIMSRSVGTFLTNPKKYYKFYNTYHIAHFGDHQLKAKEKEHQAPKELEVFLNFAYQQPHHDLKPLKSKENGILNSIKLFWHRNFMKNPKKLTKETIIIKSRDEICLLGN